MNIELQKMGQKMKPNVEKRGIEEGLTAVLGVPLNREILPPPAIVTSVISIVPGGHGAAAEGKILKILLLLQIESII